jgi:hypothetical protein
MSKDCDFVRKMDAMEDGLGELWFQTWFADDEEELDVLRDRLAEALSGLSDDQLEELATGWADKEEDLSGWPMETPSIDGLFSLLAHRMRPV